MLNVSWPESDGRVTTLITDRSIIWATIEFMAMSRSDETPPLGDWACAAACRGLTHIFFSPAAERPQTRVRRENRARQVCAACSVLEQCRAYARLNHEYGFWGGESEDDRRAAGAPPHD